MMTAVKLHRFCKYLLPVLHRLKLQIRIPFAKYLFGECTELENSDSYTFHYIDIELLE